MPEFAIVDSHVHLCDPKQFTYGWTKNRAFPGAGRYCPGHLTKGCRTCKDRTVCVR